jgi:hypothetical protein
MTKPLKVDAPEGASRKPLLFSNPFDDERLDDIENAEALWDAAYVPIYSELKQQNEIRVKNGETPLELPKLLWVRVNRPDGSAVQQTDDSMMNIYRLGFKPCGADDLESMGFGRPPTSSIGADGLIRRGVDLALFYVDSERAQRNRERQERINRDAFRMPPDSKTGEVFPVDSERKDASGSLEELKDFDHNLPEL